MLMLPGHRLALSVAPPVVRILDPHPPAIVRPVEARVALVTTVQVFAVETPEVGNSVGRGRRRLVTIPCPVVHRFVVSQ